MSYTLQESASFFINAACAFIEEWAVIDKAGKIKILDMTRERLIELLVERETPPVSQGFRKPMPSPQARLQSPSLEELGARVIDAGSKLISADLEWRADDVNNRVSKVSVAHFGQRTMKLYCSSQAHGGGSAMVEVSEADALRLAKMISDHFGK